MVGFAFIGKVGGRKCHYPRPTPTEKFSHFSADPLLIFSRILKNNTPNGKETISRFTTKKSLTPTEFFKTLHFKCLTKEIPWNFLCFEGLLKMNSFTSYSGCAVPLRYIDIDVYRHRYTPISIDVHRHRYTSMYTDTGVYRLRVLRGC